MIETISTLTSQPDSARAGWELGRAIKDAFHGMPADAVIVFASSNCDHSRLLAALIEESGCPVVMGSSSAGEFTNRSRGEGMVSAMGLRSPDMRFRIGTGQHLSEDPVRAAREVASSFHGFHDRPLPYRSALVMADALAGHTEALLEELVLATNGEYTFFGGGAGDDGRFQQTHVFAGPEALTDSVVALEILSDKPLGLGVAHGWVPDGAGLRVTEADGMRLAGLNGLPALQAFEDHAAATGQALDRDDPMPFFLHNVLGIRSSSGYKLRVPLALDDNGAILCAAAVPAGSIVHIMQSTPGSAVRAAKQATRAALDALQGHPPAAALVFDCVATRLRLDRGFDDELDICKELLQPAEFTGCNTYGQIARAEGQFSGFHNCTAVVCAFPK